MKNIFLNILILVAFSSYSQSFSVQQNNVSLSGLPTDNDFSANTYLDALSNNTLYWSIITDSMPTGWQFSNCFPSCYAKGVSNGILSISNGQDYYLNCHFYPNNTSGEGKITMEITDSAGTTELVTWHGIAGTLSGIIDNYYQTNKNKIKNIYNLSGQIVKDFKPNKIYIVQLNDNSFTKLFITN